MLWNPHLNAYSVVKSMIYSDIQCCPYIYINQQ